MGEHELAGDANAGAPTGREDREQDPPSPGHGDIDGLLDALAGALGDDTSRRQLQQLREAVEALHGDIEDHRARYRTLLDAVPDAVTLFDEHGRILDANRTACERFDMQLAELRQLTVRKLNPEVPEDHLRRVAQSREVGDTFIDHVRNRRPDGTWFPSEVHSCLFLDNGERRIIAVARDVSDQQRTLERLKASEARYRMLLDAMDKGVLIQDGEGFLISCNPAACRLLGLHENELRGLDREKLASWRFVDRDNRPLKPRELPGFEALRTGENIDSTLVGVYIPHLHAYRWLSVSSVPQLDPEGRHVMQVVSTFSDVSQLKRDSEMFLTTQQLGDLGCWELDDLRGTLFWTEHMYRIFDVAPGSSMNEARMLNFLSPESRREASRALAASRTGGEHFELELEMHTAIGRHRWISMRGRPLEREGRIYGAVGTVQNIEERKNFEHRLLRQATRNPLTDLPNRSVIMEAIEKRIAAADPDQTLTVFYIDLDRFKVLSDMLGHRTGDRLLKAAARRLRECTRDAGELAHLGNDEFLLLLFRNSRWSSPEELAGHINSSFASVFDLDGEKLALSVSIGIASWPHEGGDAEQLVRHADEAMFEAKRRGRSTWQAFASITHERQKKRLQLESQLRMAVDNGELRLVYQPQIGLQNGRLCGVEALLRWHHPQLGTIPPADFIPFAEASGDIVRIGAWVIDEACRQLAQWQQDGIDPGIMSVNVSYRQLLSGNLVNTIREAIEHYGLSGEKLELEFTERVLIDSFPETVEVFRQLRRLGVGLLIDDFGEGFSSLNYLRHLPIDGIKISHTFMQGIPDQATDAVICKAMVRIADTLDLKVIAEGVETAAQRNFMRRLGVKYAQGYLFSHPLEVGALVAFAEAVAESPHPA